MCVCVCACVRVLAVGQHRGARHAGWKEGGSTTGSQISQPASAPVSAPTPVAQADPSGDSRFAAVTAAFRGACSDAACNNRFHQTLDLHAVLPRASYNATRSYTGTRGSQTGHHLVRTWLEMTCQPKIHLCSAAAFYTLLWQYTAAAAAAVVAAAAAAATARSAAFSSLVALNT